MELLTKAMTTNMVKVRCDRMPACRPIFCGGHDSATASKVFGAKVRRRPSPTYKNNELNKALATHEASDGEALSPLEIVQSSCQCASNDLTRESNGDDANHIGPGDAIVKQPKIGTQSRKGEIEGQEQNRYEILDLLCQLDGEASLVGADKPNQKSAEYGMNPDNTYQECSSESRNGIQNICPRIKGGGAGPYR